MSLRSPGFLLASIVTGFAVILIAANVYLRTDLRSSAMSDAEQVLENTVYSYASQIEQRLVNIEATMEALALRIAADTHSPRELHLLLQQAVQTLGVVRVIGVTDLTGQVILSSRSDPPPDVSLAGRDYVDYFLLGGVEPRFLSAPVVNLVDGKWQVSLSIPVRATDGRLWGVISAVIDPRSLIESLLPTLPPGDFATLLYGDYRLIARLPWLEDRIGTTLAEAEIYRDHAGSGSDLSTGIYAAYLSDDRRVGAVLRLFHDRLVLSTSRSIETALGSWWYLEFLSALASALLFLLVLFVSWLAYRRFAADRSHARKLGELNARLQEESRRSAFLAAAKEQFLANLSHDIRTPMHAVLSLTYLLRGTGLSEQQRRYVEQIQSSGRFLVELLDDILTFSKSDAGQIVLERSGFDLADITSTLSTIMSANAADKPIAVSIDVDPKVPTTLCGDAFRLRQILVNLVGNALKFTSEGNVALRIEPVSVTAERAVLRFIVTDTGIGIPAEQLPGLFTPFTQGDASTTRRFGGTGLGLSICKRLATLMDGSIDVESEPGRGSRFTVTLPFDRHAGSLAGRPPSPSADLDGERSGGIAGLRILLVEDNRVNQEVARQMLELEGAIVSIASDGRQAVDALAAAPDGIDVVLMDVHLPVMDGYAATREIRTALGLEKLPVIALTAAALEQDRDRCRAAGMTDIVAKPFSPDRLFAAIARHAMADRPAGSPDRAGPRADMAAAVPKGSGRSAPVAFGPEIPGIDLDQASLLLDGNAKLFESLLAWIIPQAAAIAADVRADLASGNGESASRRLHSFRGAAASFAATEVCDLASRLEAAITDARRAELPGLLDRFEAATASLLAAVGHRLDKSVALSPAAGEPATAEGTARGAIPDRTIDALLASLELREMKALDLFEALRSQIERDFGTELATQLAGAMDDLRFDDALDCLKGARQEPHPMEEG